MIKTSSKYGFSSKGVMGVFLSVERYFERRAIFNRTYRELSRLSERELWDLGLCRADIERVALEATRQR